MIKDPNVRAEIDHEWTTVRVLTSLNRTRIIPSLIADETPPDEFYNLPLVLAYCALDDALKQLCIEGVFSCTKNNLSARMQASLNSTTLKWKNYDLVDEGRRARNKLAHEAVLHSKYICFRFINAIEDEFRNWALLP
jgi:hypothetical protein